MSLSVDCADLSLTVAEVEKLWQVVCEQHDAPTTDVAMRCVDTTESQRLNRQYHGKEAPTNVLTFSYPPTLPVPEAHASHDIALCLPLVSTEAQARGLTRREYTAAVITHGFLHALGFDHEHSAEEAARMTTAERAALQTAGFNPEAVL